MVKDSISKWTHGHSKQSYYFLGCFPMSEKSAFDTEKLESHEDIELAFVHSYNNVSIIFDCEHITSEKINFVNSCCSEMVHIYDICGGENERMRVSFEF